MTCLHLDCSVLEHVPDLLRLQLLFNSQFFSGWSASQSLTYEQVAGYLAEASNYGSSGRNLELPLCTATFSMSLALNSPNLPSFAVLAQQVHCACWASSVGHNLESQKGYHRTHILGIIMCCPFAQLLKTNLTYLVQCYSCLL